MEIKPDKMAAVHAGLGKMSFSDTQLLDNLKEFVVIATFWRMRSRSS